VDVFGILGTRLAGQASAGLDLCADLAAGAALLEAMARSDRLTRRKRFKPGPGSARQPRLFRRFWSVDV